MKVKTIVDGNRMEVAPEGKIDAITAPEFEAEITGRLEGITELNIDFSAVEYISSAGLRALLYLHQSMEDVNGSMTVRNVPRIVMTIFEVTDFDKVIRIV